MRGNRTPTAEELTVSERRIECVRLRVAGYSPKEIGTRLGIKAAQVRADLRHVAQKNAAEAQVWNHVLIERADLMWRKLQPKIEKGDMWAMDRGFQALDRLTTLTGADKTTNDSGSEVDKWLYAASGDRDFEQDENAILGDVIEEYDDLEPESLDEQLDAVV